MLEKVLEKQDKTPKINGEEQEIEKDKDTETNEILNKVMNEKTKVKPKKAREHYEEEI